MRTRDSAGNSFDAILADGTIVELKTHRATPLRAWSEAAQREVYLAALRQIGHEPERTAAEDFPAEATFLDVIFGLVALFLWFGFCLYSYGGK